MIFSRVHSPCFVYPFPHQGTLGLLPLWGCCNNPAMNMGVQISFHGPVFPSLEGVARSRIAGSYGNSNFHFWRNCHSVFPSICSILHLHTFTFYSAQGFQYLHILANTSFLYFFMIAILMDVKWYPIAVFIFISLMISDVEYLFSAYWPFVYLLWRNIYSSILSIF